MQINWPTKFLDTATAAAATTAGSTACRPDGHAPGQFQPGISSNRDDVDECSGGGGKCDACRPNRPNLRSAHHGYVVAPPTTDASTSHLDALKSDSASCRHSDSSIEATDSDYAASNSAAATAADTTTAATSPTRPIRPAEDDKRNKQRQRNSDERGGEPTPAGPSAGTVLASTAHDLLFHRYFW